LIEFSAFEGQSFDPVEYVHRSMHETDLATNVSRLHFGIENLQTQLKSTVSSALTSVMTMKKVDYG